MKTVLTQLPIFKRRELLLATLLGTVSGGAWSLQDRLSGSAQRVAFGAVVDDRYQQSSGFADRARGQGLRSFHVAGEVSDVWFDQILPALKTTSLPLIGLTTVGALFCFEQLAWQVGRRVQLRIAHHEEPSGIRHAGADALSPSMNQRLEASGFDFGSAAFDVALACRSDWRDCTHAPSPTAHAHDGSLLVTWALAPLTNAAVNLEASA